MSDTPQLNIPHITSGQNNKETTANEAFDALDNAVNRAIFIELNATTGMDQELDEATALRRGLIVLNGTHDGAATDPFLFYLPATEKAYTVVNESSGEVEVLGLGDTAGSGVLLSVGDVAAVHYDGTKFRAVTGGGSTGGASSLSDLDDVQTAATDLQDGDVLTWDATIGAWVSGEGGTGGASSLADLDDVQTGATDLQDGDVLTYDTTVGAWVPGEGGSGGGASVLGDLDDVDVAATDLVDGDALIYDSGMGEWRPGSPTTGTLAGVRVKHRGALVSTGSIGATNPPIVFTYASAEYDTDDFWAGSDADVLVIPPSLDGAKVRVSAGYTIDGITLTSGSNVVLSIRKNGSSTFKGQATSGGESGYTDTGPAASISTAVIEVSQGDEFDVRFNASDSSVAFGDAWLCIEVIEEPDAEGAPYDVSFYLPEAVTEPDETLVRIVAARAFTVPEDFNGSQAYAAVAAGDSFDTVLSVQKNGVEIGTITFAPGSPTGTFSTGTEDGESFAVGDRLEIVGPDQSEAIDSTLAQISVTIKATRG